MAIYSYDKVFERKLTPGGQISEYVQKAKLGSIDTNTIRKIVCVYTNINVCGYREVWHGNLRTPIKVIINENQYNDMVALVNPA